ncbi:MAG TPA: outer membrane beta-barrel protein [Lacunisphaera sp.]|nr:outer membrane beta-barrel protein [Lacunisphaera sp.]
MMVKISPVFLALAFALQPARAKAQLSQTPNHRWGLLARAETVLAARAQLGDATPFMLGAGFSGRRRMAHWWALDLGLDFLRGIDANGYHRDEVATGASVVLYPRYRDFNQIYLLGGLDFSHARVFSEQARPHLANGTSDSYDYLGLHAGLGVEILFNEGLGLMLDAVAFGRTRLEASDQYPEFFDETDHSASNTSGGCLVRSGLVLWW